MSLAPQLATACNKYRVGPPMVRAIPQATPSRSIANVRVKTRPGPGFGYGFRTSQSVISPSNSRMHGRNDRAGSADFVASPIKFSAVNAEVDQRGRGSEESNLRSFPGSVATPRSTEIIFIPR
jgi:hypothetical protein